DENLIGRDCAFSYKRRIKRRKKFTELIKLDLIMDKESEHHRWIHIKKWHRFYFLWAI
ncbi:MAG: hypothetical protein EZS28_050673, partial [Streblomastix strix]